jgi:hypothetical protein
VKVCVVDAYFELPHTTPSSTLPQKDALGEIVVTVTLGVGIHMAVGRERVVTPRSTAKADAMDEQRVGEERSSQRVEGRTRPAWPDCRPDSSFYRSLASLR